MHADLAAPACLAVDVPVRGSHELCLSIWPPVFTKRPNPQAPGTNFPDQRRQREPRPSELVSLIVSWRKEHGSNVIRRPPRDGFRSADQYILWKDFGSNIRPQALGQMMD